MSSCLYRALVSCSGVRLGILVLATTFLTSMTERVWATPPGPGPVLTTAKAVNDLQAAGIMSPQLSHSAGATIQAQDFALLLVRTVKPGASRGAGFEAAVEATPKRAVQALAEFRASTNTTSFANPSGPITREDAASTAINAAAAQGMLHLGMIPRVYPPFADDNAFSTPQSRKLAHIAVAAGLMKIGPDTVFGPRKPLTAGDAAYFLDAIRLMGASPQRE